MEREKAAILTWCNNNGPTNYGQILQCYAMQKNLERWGFDSFVVQYRRKDYRDIFKHNFSNKTALGRRLNSYFEQKYNIKVIEKEKTKRVELFWDFISRYIRLTAPCYTKEAVEYETKDCKLLVCGSDQIWNPLWVNEVLLLGFGNDKQRRVSYAPSGIFYEDEKSVISYKNMAPYIEKLDVVTVREQCGADILSKYVNKEIKVMPDPTILLSAADWDSAAVERMIEEDYIFCYVMGSIRPYQMVLRELMKRYGVQKIVYIPSNLVSDGKFLWLEQFAEVGPAEFISLIKYAKAVCTDSFHGTVMSVLYGKPFYNVSRKQPGSEKYGGAERIENLLVELEIKTRTVRNVKELRYMEDIPYESVNKRLNKIRLETDNFWKNKLTDVNLQKGII